MIKGSIAGEDQSNARSLSFKNVIPFFLRRSLQIRHVHTRVCFQSATGSGTSGSFFYQLLANEIGIARRPATMRVREREYSTWPRGRLT